MRYDTEFCSLAVKVAYQDSIFKATIRKPRLTGPFDILRRAYFGLTDIDLALL
jgi:hypothetical protein